VIARKNVLYVTSREARRGNLRIAHRRLRKVFARNSLSAAARRFSSLWPVWAVGVLLIGSSAIGWDALSVIWVRGLPGPIISFFQWLTDFGKSGWLLLPTGLLGLLLMLSDWRAVNRRVAAAWTEVGLIVGYAFMSIGGAGILMNVLKQLVGRGRPVVFDRDGAFSLVPFQFDYAQASFPSGHATTMGALAVVIATVAPRLRWPALVICAIVASSRVFVSAHYPSDVVAGFLLGAALTWFFALALEEAGLVFALKPDGTIKTRTIAIRHVFLRSGGFSIAMGSLWLAIIGRGIPPGHQGHEVEGPNDGRPPRAMHGPG